MHMLPALEGLLLIYVASLCSHTPVLPCVMTSIMLNYNGQPTCPFSLYTVNLALDVALHEHSIWFL